MQFRAWKIVDALIDRFWRAPRGFGVPIPAAAWNRDYGSGRWEFLSNMSETARFGVIHSYAVRSKSPASILDVGCGTGLLRASFSDEQVKAYVGLDLSQQAVSMAIAKSYPRTRFVVSDFDHFDPGEYYDLVIFNESIYYAADPGITFGKYWEWVLPGGACIVSIHDYDIRSKACWKRIERRAAPRYSCRIANENGQKWDVKVFVKF